MRDDLYLPLVQCFQKAIDLFREILFEQKFERCKRLLIRNVFAKRSLFFVTNRRVERCWPETNCLQTRDFFVRNSEFFGKFLVARFPAKIITHLCGNPAHPPNSIDNFSWQTDRLALVDKRALDCPIDPPTC